MNVDQLLQELNFRISQGEITREEVKQRLGIADAAPDVAQHRSLTPEAKHHFSVTKTLYLMGAGIIAIGLIFFIAQIWNDMGSLSRIVITLGLGLLVAALGSVLFKQKPDAKVGAVFHAIGGFLVPGGVLVLLEELHFHSDWSVAIAFVTVFVFYLLLNKIHRNVVLTFFAIGHGTIAIYLLANAIFDPVLGYRDMEVLFQYLTMVVGISYLVLAATFRSGWNSQLIGVLNFFGITGLLGAAFFRVFESGLWEVFYFMLVFGGLQLSVYLRSRAVLVVSTLFLLIHVSYITLEHFADSLGWPIVLVILGFVFIGMGYASVAINNKYIKSAP